MATAAHSGEKKPFGKVIVRRVLITIFLLLLMLVPMIVLLIITRQPATTYAAMAAMIGMFAVLAGSTRLGVIVVVVAALLAPLAILAGLTPFTGAALMAIMTAVVGRMSIFGLHRAVMLVPIFLAWLIISPVPWLPLNALDRINELMAKHGTTLATALDKMHPHAQTQASTAPGPMKRIIGHALMEQRFDQNYLIWIAVTFLVGGLFPVVILPLVLRRFPLPKAAPVTHTRHEAVPYTITITVLTAVATYWCLDHPKMTAGAFLIATILVLAQVGSEIKWRLTIERVVGTLVGAAAFFLAVQAIGGTSYTEVLGMPFPLNMYGIGLVFGALAILAKFSPRLWIYYVLIVPAAAALNAFSSNQAVNFGEQRFVDNAVGAVLVVAAALITLGASHLDRRRHGDDEPSAMPPGASPA